MTDFTTSTMYGPNMTQHHCDANQTMCKETLLLHHLTRKWPKHTGGRALLCGHHCPNLATDNSDAINVSQNGLGVTFWCLTWLSGVQVTQPLPSNSLTFNDCSDVSSCANFRCSYYRFHCNLNFAITQLLTTSASNCLSCLQNTRSSQTLLLHVSRQLQRRGVS